MRGFASGLLYLRRVLGDLLIERSTILLVEVKFYLRQVLGDCTIELSVILERVTCSVGIERSMIASSSTR